MQNKRNQTTHFRELLVIGRAGIKLWAPKQLVPAPFEIKGVNDFVGRNCFTRSKQQSIATSENVINKSKSC